MTNDLKLEIISLFFYTLNDHYLVLIPLVTDFPRLKNSRQSVAVINLLFKNRRK